ncbi:MAG: DUF922 domain-containing Zn-dependent protease [Gemmatimonadetes bacterium]|nr:DUF922 domain-containing Zn-dependent protease [Gemmatimonadota bacterium]
MEVRGPYMAIKNWPSKVTWAQFKKVDKPPGGATTFAHIEGEYRNPPGKQFQVAKVGKHYKLTNVNLVLKVIPAETWVVKGKQDKVLLKHEQGHWDILGLMAREYHREIKKLRANSVKQLKARFKKLEARIAEKRDKLNSGSGGYDTETDHGKKKAAQIKWDALIAACKKTGKDLPEK